MRTRKLVGAVIAMVPVARGPSAETAHHQYNRV